MSDADEPENPYVGLRPFFAKDALHFFGRETQVAGLLDILREQRFLGVVGSSGSGKSSLIRAGLVPALLGGFLVGNRDHWHLVQVKPGDAPIANLASALVSELPNGTGDEDLETRIREDHAPALLDFVARRLPADANLFILIDQFEELFAFRERANEPGEAGERERARRRAESVAYVDLLLRLAEARELPAYLALTMRTDFLGDCDLFYGLPEALNRGRYLVPRMTRGELRDAIECPAMLRSAQIAPRLSDQLLNELGDRFDRLPLLQHALMRTWDAWRSDGGIGLVDLENYVAAGGIERALNNDADRAIQGLDEAVVARVFKRLVDTDPNLRRVRSPARVSELAAGAGTDAATVEAIVRRFESDGRSFVYASADGDPADLRIDISHESLIRRWDRLGKWADEEQRDRDEFVELVRRARRFARGEAAPLQGPELLALADWKDRANPSAAWAARYCSATDDFSVAMAYVEASVRQKRKSMADAETRRRWAQAWAPPLLALFAVLSPWLIDIPSFARRVDDFFKNNSLSDPWKLWDDTMSSYQDPNSIKVLFFLSICFALYISAKQFYIRHATSRVEADLDLRGWRIEPRIEEKDPLVLLKTEYGSLPRRMLGKAIDLTLFFAIVLLSGILMGIFSDTPDDGSFDLALFTWFGLIAAWAWLYSILQLISRHQATLGMRVAGVFRTDLYGSRLSFARANALSGLRIFSYLFYGLGFLMQPFTARRQTFHDLMARSVVLRGRLPKAPATEAEPEVAEPDGRAEAAPGDPGLPATV